MSSSKIPEEILASGYWTEGVISWCPHDQVRVVLGRENVRELLGVLEREKAQIGVLITLQDPTRDMRTEAVKAGFYDSSWGKHPRCQILTIAELLEGKRVDYPPSTSVTFKKAPGAKGEEPEIPTLFETPKGKRKRALAVRQ